MIDITSENYQNDFDILYNELKEHSHKLVKKKILVSLSKADLVDENEINNVSGFTFRRSKTKPVIFSSVSGFGINELLDSFWKTLEEINDESS
jgi:GTP-binding protein